MIFPPRIAFGRWGEFPELDAFRIRMQLEAITLVNEQIFRLLPDLPGVYDAYTIAVMSYAFVPTEHDDDDDWADWLAVLELGYGDCEDLSMARAGELRARRGVEAWCDFDVVNVDGRDEYHIFVVHPDGTKEDPSRATGMRTKNASPGSARQQRARR